jgi:hypothetical protein
VPDGECASDVVFGQQLLVSSGYQGTAISRKQRGCYNSALSLFIFHGAKVAPAILAHSPEKLYFCEVIVSFLRVLSEQQGRGIASSGWGSALGILRIYLRSITDLLVFKTAGVPEAKYF